MDDKSLLSFKRVLIIVYVREKQKRKETEIRQVRRLRRQSLGGGWRALPILLLVLPLEMHA